MSPSRLPMPFRAPAVLRFAVSGVLLATVLACPAQPPYKVIGADGRVTYTDRPSTAADSRVRRLGDVAPAAEVALPFELRQVVGRYPVVLYVTGDDCVPCDAGRRLLRGRGIPYSERQVQTPEDVLALERVSGGREAPTLGIGSQILRGLTPETWNAYLDSAGYPRESRLPANYLYPTPTPLTPRASAPAVAPEPAADLPPTLPSLPGASGGIRF